MTERPAIGIDLGTTHCAVAQAYSLGEDEGKARVEVLKLHQLVSKDRWDSTELLPSFAYLPPSSEKVAVAPWPRSCPWIIGGYARQRAQETPDRVIASAKSWLSSGHVDRREALLPVSAAEDVGRLSPVETTFRVLEHLSEAFAFGADGRQLANEDVILTVPASFDAAARECTVEAALAAGIDQLTLLEEPQAAFYAWLERQGDAFRKQLSVGDVVLVIDTGGGTTDFAAIRIEDEDGVLSPRRVAVGEHILLGGDNMDLALGYIVRRKLEQAGKQVDAWQTLALTHAARAAKEALLTDGGPESFPISIAGRGSSLFGGALRAELTREDVQAVLVDGYFPEIPLDQPLARRTAGGLRSQGLPYASDPAVTAHLAHFLRTHAKEGNGSSALLAPTHVLFNGGVFRSRILRERVLSVLASWLKEQGAPAAVELSGADCDLAVARGAAYYGLVRRGRGLRVRGGTAQAFYVGVESPMPAVPGMEPPITGLCVAPFGMEEGAELALEEIELSAIVGESVQFRFFSSAARSADPLGATVDSPETELTELSPIAITLPADTRKVGEWVPVTLMSRLTAIGTLELWAVPRQPIRDGEAWKVELSVRSGAPEAQQSP